LGAILGGIFIGIAEATSALYLSPTLVDVISFGLLVVILVTRPASAFRAA
jgi:branched-chain amino acid transport system permease protein